MNEYLTKEIAQEIVNRTMKVINRNINVMNDQGEIIGSGDPSRIGQLHEGAVHVLKKRQPVLIGEAEVEDMRGVKPGINLPIYFQNQIVGVIGITGNPEEVHPFGELIRMTAEMLLQQAFLLEQRQWRDRIQEEIVNQVILGEIHGDALDERASFLGVDLTLPRVVLIVNCKLMTDRTPVPDSRKLMQHIYSVIKKRLEANDLLTFDNDHQFIILKKIEPNNRHRNRTVIHSLFQQITKDLSHLQNIRFEFGIGSYHPGLKGIRRSYLMCKKTMEIGKRLFPLERIYETEDMMLPVVLADLMDSEKAEELLHSYDSLIKHDKWHELSETLLTFVEQNGEWSRTAEKLYIHRNTLRYRMEKISSMTGKDPRKVKELFELYVAVLLLKLKRV